jgi:hypothetical protein
MAKIAECYRSVTPRHPDKGITDFTALTDKEDSNG